MSKYKFSAEERYAVYAVHNEKCYMCTVAVDLKSMQVDHIIPESLLGKPKELNDVKSAYGLNAEFNINSFENWMPACSPCNRKKSSTVFEFTPVVQMLLQKAKEKAIKAREIANKIVSRREITKALNILLKAKNANLLTSDDIKDITPLVNFHFQESQVGDSNSPLVLTPFIMAIPNYSDKYIEAAIKSPLLSKLTSIDGITFMKSDLKFSYDSSSSKYYDLVSGIDKQSVIGVQDISNVKNPFKNPFSITGAKMCPNCGFVLYSDTANCSNCNNKNSFDSKDIIF